MVSASEYIRNIKDGLITTLIGMRITGKYLFQKPITFQYPDERMPIPNRFREKSVKALDNILLLLIFLPV